MKRNGRPRTPERAASKQALLRSGELKQDSPFKRNGKDSAYSGERAVGLLRREGMIETCLANPEADIPTLASLCGIGERYFAVLTEQPEFKAELAKRRAELSPLLTATLEERALPIVKAMYERLAEKVPTMTVRELYTGIDTLGRNLGLGVPTAAPGTVNFVVQVPPRAKNSSEWSASLSQHGITVDVEPKEAA